MLHDLIQISGGKETVFMTDELPKVRRRLTQLRTGHRGKNITYVIRPSVESDKYRRPPSMNFDPSGDADSRSYRARKAFAKKIKRRNKK